MSRCYVAVRGYKPNPLLKIPRNMSCPCDSKKKFKKCCLRGMPPFVTEDLAKQYAAGMGDVSRIKFVNEPVPEVPND